MMECGRAYLCAAGWITAYIVWYLAGRRFCERAILNYMAYIDQLLADDAGKNEEDYEKIMEEHKLQLTFFMHERLVHLLVTLTFALLAFATFFALVFAFQPGLVVLFIALLVLLVPYIMHYYLLENGVQKMYRQYDEMYKRARAQSNPPQK